MDLIVFHARGDRHGKTVGIGRVVGADRTAAARTSFAGTQRRPSPGRFDWSRSAVDSSSIRAVGGGEATGPNPTDRARPGTKHHVMVDGRGIPLAVRITGANVPDLQQLLPLIVNVPPVRGKVGHPQSRPQRLYADRAYDSEPARTILRWLGIEPWLAKRRTEHGSGMGKIRWVVERTISWLHQQRRLRVRYERRADIHAGFLTLGACLICFHVFLGFR